MVWKNLLPPSSEQSLRSRQMFASDELPDYMALHEISHTLVDLQETLAVAAQGEVERLHVYDH